MQTLSEPDVLAVELPAGLREPITACLNGWLAPNLALMQLCLNAPTADRVSQALSAVVDPANGPTESAALAALRRLWRDQPDAFETVKRVAGLVDHAGQASSPEAQLTACAEAFDRAVNASAEAGVALYSLGSALLLRAATAEVVDSMRRWGLLGAQRAALEIGCGTGRFVAALGPELRHVTGIDISAKMIAAASEHCAALPNVRLLRTSGRDLSFCADESLDLIYAVDSFPYIVQAGETLVRCHFEEAGRVLKPNGALLILNYSYRGDWMRDRGEMITMAGAAGLALKRAARGDFTLWDGATFLLKREGP